MNRSFKRILIPVDFSINTEVAIHKAYMFAGEDASLHLLHVQYYGYPLLSFSASRFIWPDEKKDHKAAEIKLLQIKQRIASESSGLSVTFDIDNKHDIQNGIINAAKRANSDLIIIGKRSRHSYLSFLNTIHPEKIATKTDAPVLVCKPGSLNTQTKEILVPVSDRIEEHKLQMIEAVSNSTATHTRLLAFNEYTDTKDLAITLSQYYQRIRLDYRGLAETQIVPTRFCPRTLLRIAKKLKSDLLILKPGSETKLNFMGGQIFDDLDIFSTLQVLLVN